MTDRGPENGLKKWLLLLKPLWDGLSPNALNGRKTRINGDMPAQRRKTYTALLHNLGLMEEAVGRYLAIADTACNYDGFETATAMSKTYKKARAGFGPVNPNALTGAAANQWKLVHEIFNQISLLSGAADMSGLLEGTDFGAGFETLTSVYMPGANMFQPQGLSLSQNKIDGLKDAARHFEEEKQKLMGLI